MRNDGNTNLGGERVVIAPSEEMSDFLPEPGEHEARNLANAALNTEGFSPDEIVSVQEDVNADSMPVAPEVLPVEQPQERAKKELTANVVKIITTDRQLDSNREIKAAIDESEKFMGGKMSPFDFANEIRGSLEDIPGEKVA